MEAVDGNTVTINGQVFTVDDSYNLDISAYVQAGQTITCIMDHDDYEDDDDDEDEKDDD